MKRMKAEGGGIGERTKSTYIYIQDTSRYTNDSCTQHNLVDTL